MFKNFFSVVTTVICLLIFSFVGLYFYAEPIESSLVSPLKNLSKLRFSDNIWFPSDESIKVLGATKEPIITAEAAFFVETKTGKVLYEKNIHKKLSIASLVKIMTTIITLENKTYSDELKVSQRAADIEPDKMMLEAGEKLTIEELLQGLFLVSANDASEVLAEGVTGRREEFINLMNSKAKILGMNNTLFLNPSGLEEDFDKQYSTAYDVALMARFAISHFPNLLEITSKSHIYISETKTHQEYDLYSGINLLTTYPGVIGFKTGYTPEAGLTLVTIARIDGKEVLGVLLNSVERRDDAKALLDYSFEALEL